MRAVVTGLLVAAASVASAQDALPLRRGFYVREPAVCVQASAATLVLFSGRGISPVHAECRITQQRRLGNAFDIRQDCRDLRGGHRIPSNLERITRTQAGFERLAEGQITVWRYCPQAQLPSPWRGTRIE
jgi:hypothetical protein